MTFTIKPEVLVDLLDQICRDMPKRQRKNFKVTLSAGKNHISIIGNGMLAAVSLPVRGEGQCKLGWQKVIEVLNTFPAQEPVRVECRHNRLQINSFSMGVEDYKPESVPQDQPIPVVSLPDPPTKSAKRRAQSKETPRLISPDGYSLPQSDDAPSDDCTGKLGTVSPEDMDASREPVVCPVCQSVGYFKKFEWRGRIFCSHQRGWADAKDAHTVAILRGDEKTRLCPRCLRKRLQDPRHFDPIEGKQIDMYEKA